MPLEIEGLYNFLSNFRGTLIMFSFHFAWRGHEHLKLFDEKDLPFRPLRVVHHRFYVHRGLLAFVRGVVYGRLKPNFFE